MKDLLDDVARRLHETAGSAEAYQQSICVLSFGFRDGGFHHADGYRMNDAVDIHLNDTGRERGSGQQNRQEKS